MQTLGVTGNEETPSVEDPNEENIMGICQTACLT